MWDSMADFFASKCLGRANKSSPLLPSTSMPRCAAAGARGGAEVVGFAGGGRLIDLAFAAGADVVARRFARGRAVGTVGQGFRAVHFVEVGLVDAGGGAARGRASLGGGNGGAARGLPLTPA